jgi:hypothetical protein
MQRAYEQCTHRNKRAVFRPKEESGRKTEEKRGVIQ